MPNAIAHLKLPRRYERPLFVDVDDLLVADRFARNGHPVLIDNRRLAVSLETNS